MRLLLTFMFKLASVLVSEANKTDMTKITAGEAAQVNNEVEVEMCYYSANISSSKNTTIIISYLIIMPYYHVLF